jgi:hypothetical protein
MNKTLKFYRIEGMFGEFLGYVQATTRQDALDSFTKRNPTVRGAVAVAL